MAGETVTLAEHEKAVEDAAWKAMRVAQPHPALSKEQREQAEEAFDGLAGYVPGGHFNANLNVLRNFALRAGVGGEG